MVWQCPVQTPNSEVCFYDYFLYATYLIKRPELMKLKKWWKMTRTAQFWVCTRNWECDKFIHIQNGALGAWKIAKLAPSLSPLKDTVCFMDKQNKTK